MGRKVKGLCTTVCTIMLIVTRATQESEADSAAWMKDVDASFHASLYFR